MTDNYEQDKQLARVIQCWADAEREKVRLKIQLEQEMKKKSADFLQDLNLATVANTCGLTQRQPSQYPMSLQTRQRLRCQGRSGLLLTQN